MHTIRAIESFVFSTDSWCVKPSLYGLETKTRWPRGEMGGIGLTLPPDEYPRRNNTTNTPFPSLPKKIFYPTQLPGQTQ